MRISGVSAGIAFFVAAMIGVAGAGVSPVQAQTKGEQLDTIIEKRAKRKARWDSTADRRAAWKERRQAAAGSAADDGQIDEDEFPFGEYAGETRYERQSRGLYAPGYDIEGVLQNNYNGDRQ